MTITSLELVEVKPGIKIPLATLKQFLPTTELVLFFCKMYGLNVSQTSSLIRRVSGTSLTEALFGEGEEHSSELQDYIVELGYEGKIRDGDIVLRDKHLTGQLLPEVWAQWEVQIARSITEVSEKLGSLVASLDGKQGYMMFETLRVMNAKRPVIGDYRATIKRRGHQPNLIVLDTSGSMSERTIRTIIEDVVALSYKADAHLAIVSDTATHWEPGGFNVAAVLDAAEYCGTQYETLAQLFERNWGKVVTIADYDSAPSAAEALALCKGRIGEVFDISLVNRPTFLAECLGQLSDRVTPLLVAETYLN